MFRESQDIQITLDDRMLYINDQTRKALDASRAKLVGDIIYPNIDETKFSDLYSTTASRPNILIRQYVSALVLKRMYRMPDDVLIEFLRCGAMNFQYALHTTQEETQPLSESSIRRFRRKLEAFNEEHGCDLVKEEFERISKMLAVEMGVLHDDPNAGEDDVRPVIVRMDSMEIEAHAKVMPRIEILYMTNVLMIRYLLKKDFADMIPDELSHYYEDGDHNKVMYYRVSDDKKAGVQDTRAAEIIHEMLLLQDALIQNFTPEFLKNVPEYQTFQRVLEEQTRLDDNGCRIPKDKTEISAESVQNPFDTTATYRYKRGHHHGHVMNVAEAVDDDGNGIIIQASVCPNTQTDSRMAEEYVEQLPEDGPAQILTADGAYNSDRLEELASKKNVTVQTTSLTGKAPDDIFGDFTLNSEGTEILYCPAGNSPVSCQYNPKTGYVTGTMPENCCAACPHRMSCKAKVNNKKKKSTIRVTGKMIARAIQARRFSTEEGKKNACRRNGVEGIMSVMRRKYDIDHIPVFSLDRLKVWIWTTLLSYNLVKYQKFKLSLEKSISAA